MKSWWKSQELGRNLLLLCLCSGMSVFLSGCASNTGPDCNSGYTATCRIPETSTAVNEKEPLKPQEQTVLDSPRGTIASQVPASARPAVTKQYKYFLRQGRKTMKVFSKRSEKYLTYAKKVFRSKGMPEELAYLAVVESGYNPVARSGVGAAGAWQFMPYTGMKYGLNKDEWQDERLDVYKATVAAANYLQKLYNQFGDWPTAIAAYNAGEGKMQRACDAAGEKTFFGVCQKNANLPEKTRLKEETTQYVPRFIAISSIMENLESLGFDAIHPEKAPQMTAVKIKPGTDLKAMADAVSMPWGEFHRNNPHHLRTVSNTNVETTVYVPEGNRSQAMAFVRNPVLASSTAVALAKKERIPVPAKNSGNAAQNTAGTYRIAQGETLYAVAKKHGTTVPALMRANNITNPNQLHAGDRIRIAKAGGAQNVSAQVADTRAAGPTGKVGRGSRSYKVQANDNLWQISRKMNVSVEDLKRWNNLDNHDLQVGQTLVVSR